MDSEEIHVLKNAIKEAVRGAMAEASSDRSPFPLYTAREVARVFGVSRWTVRDWHRKGLLRGRYQILSGRACRLVFTNRDLVNFLDQHFPSKPGDFTAKPTDPRSSKAERLERMFRMNRLYARRRKPRESDG